MAMRLVWLSCSLFRPFVAVVFVARRCDSHVRSIDYFDREVKPIQQEYKKTPEDFFRGLVHRLYVTAQHRCGSDHHGRLVCQPSRRFAAAHRFASRSVKNVMSSIIALPFMAQVCPVRAKKIMIRF